VPCRMSTPLWVIVMRMLRPAEPQADRSIIPNSEPIGRLDVLRLARQFLMTSSAFTKKTVTVNRWQAVRDV
jgi:hypothetical protein